MARPLRGEFEVELGDEKFTLRLGLGELEALEAQFGTGIGAIAIRFPNGTAGLRETRAILRQGFIGAGIKKSDAELSSLIEKSGIRVILQAAALINSLFEGQEGNAEAAVEETK